MSVNSGLPQNRKLFRYVQILETEGGEKRPFQSILLTEPDAKSEMYRLINEGLATKDTVHVEADQAAVAEYQSSKK